MANGIAELRQNELFRALSNKELAVVAPLCTDFVAVEGATLFKEGLDADYLYLVKEGRITLQKTIPGFAGARPRRSIITLCQAGSVAGWSALVEPHKYTLSALVSEAGTLIRMDAAKLSRALDRHPEVGHKVMKSLAGVVSLRLSQMTEALINSREANANFWPNSPSLADVISDPESATTS